jgi:hypothetical protein
VKNLAKKALVTEMLSFPFLKEKCCEHNFLSVFKRKYLGTFFVNQLYNRMETNLGTKNTKKFICENCDFRCSKQSYWERHIITAKHAKLTNVNNMESPDKKKLLTYICNLCAREYKSRVGLWKHSKKCEIIKPSEVKETKLYEKEKSEPELKMLTNLILELVKSNTDLQKQMMEVCKNGINNNNSVVQNNSHNKTFNMQFFLNEQCKDAMNIMDFVNSMTLEFSDLEEVGKVGYVEGISNIIIRKLNELDIYKRPIHCSDAKREIMYVKDENVWEKENSTYDKLRKAIKHVTCKNSAMLEPWSKEHPQCMNTSHRLNDVYVQMIGQCMGGKESFVESENKIMKKIAKAVLIEK